MDIATPGQSRKSQTNINTAGSGLKRSTQVGVELLYYNPLPETIL
jgi:hypothetical protein